MSASHVDPFVAHTTQKFPLGHVLIEPASRSPNTLNGVGTALPANSGERKWVYVFNDEASTAFAQGEVVIRDPSAATHDAYGAIQAASGTVYSRLQTIGVAQFAIAAGSYGFVLADGVGEIAHGTADITADTELTTGGSAAGTVIDWADGNTIVSEAVIAFSFEAATAASGTVTARIKCGG